MVQWTISSGERSASVSVVRTLGRAASDRQRAGGAGALDYFTLNPYVTWRMLGVVGVTLYGTVGLTRASPSQAFGVRFSL